MDDRGAEMVKQGNNMSKLIKTLIASSALGLLASPVIANVKAGVDAWERGDFATAVSQWRPMAVRGDADAQFNLAQAYRFGRGVPADMKQAEEWYRRAAGQGHLQAEDNLGLIMFQNGDTRNAMPIIERSANRGEARAQYVLGTSLFNGDNGQKDWPRAYAYMTRASASGLSRASSALAQMDQFIPLDQRQKGLVMARQLEATAAQSRFAQVAPSVAPAAAPAPVKVGASYPARQSYPAPQPYPAPQSYPAQQTYPAPQAYPQSYPAPQPMPQSVPMPGASDPYTDSPAVAVADTQDRMPQSTGKRSKIKTSTRSALPSPKRSSRRQVPAEPQELPQVGSPGENDDWQAQTTQRPVAAPAYPTAPYPGDPAASYPQQSYPQQNYPQTNYPPVPYPEPIATPPPRRVAAPAVVRKPAPAPRPAAVVRPQMRAAAPAARPASSGGYRIQLGAFSNQAGADVMWKSLRGRVASLSTKQPYLVRAGNITRLQAGGYASRADAERACSSVRSSGNSCLVVGG